MAKRPLGACFSASEPAHSLNSRWKNVVLDVDGGMMIGPVAAPPPPACKRSSRKFS